MKHILDVDEQKDELHEIFEQLREGNSILFLGAGASVGEKRYLSKEVIQYYDEYLGKSMNEPNITKFVDMLSADPSFDRGHFDQEVERMLRKLTLTDGHRVMAKIPWREIITTNYDLLVEQAYDEIRSTNPLDLVPVRSLKKYNFRPANTDIKYVKLNGCISDKSEFPLAFSTEDFTKAKRFYKNVLNDLRNISPKIQLLSAGYSFTDEFGQELLEKFDSHSYREKRWIINIDPFPNENALSYYTSKRMRIVKCSFSDFFSLYDEWNEEGLEYIVKKKKILFTTSKDSFLTLPNELALNLNGVVNQLNDYTKDRFISDVEYLKGEEPNYNVILKGFDVVRDEQNKKISDKIIELNEQAESTFIPIFFVTGEFGIGKSTFCLRLIHKLKQRADIEMVAFEILDFVRLRKEYLIQLFERCNAKNIVLFCDEIEVDSVFKSVVELRRELSIEQFNDFNVFIIAPIRENILAKYQSQRDVRESHEIRVKGELLDDEIDELLTKLQSAGLVEYRGEAEKRALISKVKKEFGGDSFVSLLEIVTGGQHITNLIGAYNELSEDCRSAFLFTALMHRYKLSVPASWLKHVVSMEWDDFVSKVIRIEGKGLLIQEIVNSTGTDPDLFFRTKHPIIAKRLIESLVPSTDKQYKMYVKLLSKVDYGATNSKLATNLLKALRTKDVYSQAKLNKLFDVGYNQLSDDPFYLLNYAINLQHRRTKSDLKKALEHILYAESLLEWRNHRFIHRRGVINFDLARIYFKEEKDLNRTSYYLNEAKELFAVKQLLDPFSAYSYSDFIRVLIWEVSNINFDQETELRYRIQIQELFDLAQRAVTEDSSRIERLRNDYVDYLRKNTDDKDYLLHLNELYENPELRPYACILLYGYFNDKKSQEGENKREELLEEMELYLDNNEVVKFLFKHYGRQLHNTKSRIFFFKLAKDFDFLEKDIPLRYHYFHFVAESYSHNFHYGNEHLAKIRSKYYGLSPEFHIVWKDNNGEEEIFDGHIVKNDGKRFKAVKSLALQRTLRLVKGDYSSLPVGAKVKLKIHFYIIGIRAEIVSNS